MALGRRRADDESAEQKFSLLGQGHVRRLSAICYHFLTKVFAPSLTCDGFQSYLYEAGFYEGNIGESLHIYVCVSSVFTSPSLAHQPRQNNFKKALLN